MAAKLASDPDWEVRYEAIECLLENGGRRWSATARAALADPEATVAVTAMQCLVSWEVTATADEIAGKLVSSSELVRCYAAWAVGRLGGPGHVALLRRRFRRVRDDLQGSALAEALFTLTNQPRYLDHLLAQLRSTDPEARAFTTNSLVGVVNKKNFPRIACALAQALATETSEGVLPSIRRDLTEIISLAVDGELT